MTLLLTDNEELLNRFLALLKKKGIDRSSFDFAYSPVNHLMADKYEDQTWIVPLRVKNSVGAIIEKYNMVLSQRRAAIVNRYFNERGIAASRIQIVSNGEEKPLCTERDEGCRSRNRRDEFVVLSGL